MVISSPSYTMNSELHDPSSVLEDRTEANITELRNGSTAMTKKWLHDQQQRN